MWYQEYGIDGDVVLSSRVRLARNIQGIPFPRRTNAEQQEKVLSLCKDAMLKNDNDWSKGISYIDLSLMEDYEKQAIAEKHIISPQMMENNRKRGILLSDDNKISILLNEEDHIRIQVMEAGFALEQCFQEANRVDDWMEQTVDYAFDEQIGYLTCCPTNAGTGMRASVMVHLPALTMSGTINRVIDSLNQLGVTVRGIFGEGSKATGHIYQISNQLTLGAAEEDIIEKFKQIITEVIAKEREMRQRLYQADKYRLEDRLMRSYGILRHAVILTSGEAMKCLSDVRLALDLGLITDLKPEVLNAVTYEILPANIMKEHNLANPADRDLKRAEIVRERMSE
ncbi:MAG: protein arginine kinase [Clostridia bacterium]|nr:protein arginine kinase [Clostridia bacterium]